MGPGEQAAHQLSQSISRRMSGPIQDSMDMLADAEFVAVVCHIHPDADAIGAAAAMVMALRQRGIRAVASYGNDEAPAKSLLTIPGWEFFVAPGDIPETVDTWVSVDCASPERLGVLRERMMESDRLIVVDHHDTNSQYGTVNMVDDEAESSTMVLLDFFEVWGIKLTRDMAHALYAGLLTDTVSFQFGRSRMHTAAARLLNKGLDPRTIGAQLLEGHPFEYLPFLGRVMATAVRVPEWADGAGLVHVTISHEDMADVGHDEVEAVVDVVRTTKGGDVDEFARTQRHRPEARRVLLEHRRDVAAVAASLGGGGHLRAAGYNLNGDRDAVLGALLGASDVAAATIEQARDADGS